MYLRYIQTLQPNDCVAWPENWAGILDHSSYQKRLKESGVKQTALQYPWNNHHSIHYIPVHTGAIGSHIMHQQFSGNKKVFLFSYSFFSQDLKHCAKKIHHYIHFSDSSPVQILWLQPPIFASYHSLSKTLILSALFFSIRTVSETILSRLNPSHTLSISISHHAYRR